MVFDKNPVTLEPDYDLMEPSFESMLDMTIDRLWERRVHHSIRRIREMEEELKGLERELDDFIGRYKTDKS